MVHGSLTGLMRVLVTPGTVSSHAERLTFTFKLCQSRTEQQDAHTILSVRRRRDAASASPVQGPKLFSHYAQPDARCATWIRSPSFFHQTKITIPHSRIHPRFGILSLLTSRRMATSAVIFFCLDLCCGVQPGARFVLLSSHCEPLHSLKLRALDLFSLIAVQMNTSPTSTLLRYAQSKLITQ